MTDVLQQLLAQGAAKQLALPSRIAEVSSQLSGLGEAPRPMPYGGLTETQSGVATGIAALPMLLGGLLGGSQGLRAGAGGAQLGLGQFLGDVEKTQKEERAAEDLRRKLLSEELRGLRSAEQALGLEGVRQLGKMEVTAARTDAEKIPDDKLEGLKKVLVELGGEEKAALLTPGSTYKDFDRIKGAAESVERKEAEGRRQQKLDRDTVKWIGQEIDAFVPAGTFPLKQPRAVSATKAEKEIGDYEAAELILERLTTAIQSKDPDAIAQAYQYYAAAVVELKTQKNMGANFTIMEKGLIDAGLPFAPGEVSLANFREALQRKTFRGEDALKVLERTRAVVKDTMLRRVAALGYGVEGVRYDRPVGRVPLDKDGFAIPSFDILRPRYERLGLADEFDAIVGPRQRGGGGATPEAATDPDRDAFKQQVMELLRGK